MQRHQRRGKDAGGKDAAQAAAAGVEDATGRQFVAQDAAKDDAAVIARVDAGGGG
jgi:hypothetical protein